MKRAMSSLLLLTLAACSMTGFDRAPVAVGACDAQLPGRWLSAAGDGEPAGAIELRIDPACGLQVTEHHDGQPRRRHATTFRVGADGAARYAWVDAAWVQAGDGDHLVEARVRADPGDVFLVRYRVEGDRLAIEHPDSTAIAHRMIDGDIDGEVRKAGSDLYNRVVDARARELLQAPGFFHAKALVFHRAGTQGP